MTTADSIAAAAARLRKEGAALRQRPAGEVESSLCRVLDEWRNAGSAIARRSELQSALAAEVGFSPACIREGLQRGLAEWNGKALREVIARELGALSSSPSKLVHGFDLTAVLLAGAIPMPSLLAILLPLVLRSPVLVKTSSRDPVTAPHVAASVARIDPQLGRCIEVVDFPGRDDSCANRFLAADCVVAMGSDSTLESVTKQVRPSARLVSYGHRLSLAIVGPIIESDAALADVAGRIALDTALWDQQGCLSPAAVYVLGSAELARNVAAALAAAMERAEQHWPRGSIDTAAAAAIQRERSEAEMRRADDDTRGTSVELHSSADTSWTVVLESDPGWRPTPLQRFLRVYPLDGTHGVLGWGDALESALAPIARHLAAVAVEGFGDETPVISQRLAALGASRICRAGELQAPPLGWHHDGKPLLLPLARITDIESVDA